MDGGQSHTRCTLEALGSHNLKPTTVPLVAFSLLPFSLSGLSTEVSFLGDSIQPYKGFLLPSRVKPSFRLLYFSTSRRPTACILVHD
ncbi:hypothetical protein FJTKL_14797 [Diaporthe vaccinii]|uniref:Uncharacterized protein n=1 Tax=Diaporthe vaccinii TaxID=105482 RepID=A0ABR4F831_9PEZI